MKFQFLRIYNFPYTFLLVLMFALADRDAIGQLMSIGRYEKEIKPSDNGFTMVPMAENGMAIIHEQDRFLSGKKLWEVFILDSDLNEKWHSDIEVKSGFSLIGYDYTDHHVYFLFREGDKDFNKFNLAQINISSYTIRYFEIDHEFSFRITHFNVVGENVLFGGYVSREPAVMLYETASQSLRVIPGFFLKDTELLDVRVNNNNTFNTLLIERNSLDKRHLVMKTFDQTGILLLEDYIEIEKDKNILTGISSGLKREELLIVGTYTEGLTNVGLGFYSVLVDPFSEQSINYIPYTSLNHLLGYLPDKRASKIKAKAKEKIEIGKNPDYKAHLLPIRIHEADEGFYFLSEMYDPASANNRPYWNNYNNPYYGYGYSPYSYNPVMNRYASTPYSYNNTSQTSSAKMIESVLTLFDNNGKLMWDTSLKFDNIKRYAPEQSSDFIVKSGLIHLTYKKDKELIVSTASLRQEPELDTLSIPLLNPDDVIRHESEDDTGIRFWNGDSVFVWGYQSLRNKNKNEGDQVRYVFYINKFEAD